MFCVTNALLGRSTPAQLPDSLDDSALAERLHNFFADKVVEIHRTIDSHAEVNAPERQQPNVDEHAQFRKFMPATMEGIIRIVHLSTTKTCDLDPMPTNMLKDNIDLLAPILTNIVIASLQPGIVPQNMKHA
ncbi:hypothetical protein LSAT2_000477 [Lamellibrachia satsuma]|nr:hypothetical protein LSAT2_000477 [Lamellibrachia satsuma]